MNKILVTGGAGNIGGALVEKLVQSGRHEVVVVDNLSTGSILKLPDANEPRCRFIKGDVNEFEDIAPIMTAHRFDYVFHLAAVVGVARTQQNPIRVLTDISGIRNVLGLAKNTAVKRVFFSSSSEVYGEPVSLPQHEHTTPLNSRIPYAVVKNVGESFCKSFFQEYRLSYTIFRFFNTYGPGQSTDFVIPRFIRAAVRGEDITIYGDGLQSRTFTYIDDTIDTCLACFERQLHVNDVINIGNDHVSSILELAKLIIALTNSKSSIRHLPPLSDGDMTRRQPDNENMRHALARPLVSLEEGIRRMLSSESFRTAINA